jgi:polysaccharide pyruvyl transferase WcaK-like protein
MLKKYEAYLVGYYGMSNSGDDALMHATAWATRNLLHCQTTSIGLYGPAKNKIKTNHQQALSFNQKFPGQNRLLHYQAALQSKAIVFGGGSVLHSESDINLKRHLMTLAGRNNSRAVGVSIGPFHSIAAEKSCTKFLNECAFVGVRDQKSLAMAKSLAPNANVEKTFDLAPLLLCAQKQKPLTTKRKGIALSLCPIATNAMGEVDKKAEQARIHSFCELITLLYQNTGETITLLEFNGHSLLGDWQINNAILSRLHNKVPVVFKRYNPNPFAVLKDLASYKVVISMRLHGAILGYLANTPVLSINYHEKCQGWCQQIGLKDKYQFSPQQLTVKKLVWQIEQGLSYGFIPPSLPVSSAVKSSLSNWSISHETSKLYSRYSTIQ